MNFTAESNFEYSGRRSVVLAPHAAVASSQPLATQAGIEILQKGGSAADAAIAVAAAMQATQPCSTGLGGDAFALYFDSSAATGSTAGGSHGTNGSVYAYNGSGRSPAALSLEVARAVADEAAAADEDVTAQSTGTPHSADGATPNSDGVQTPKTSVEQPELPNYHAHTVTVPGAADAWCAVHKRFGRLPLAEVLAPAIRIAEEGFSVEPMTSRWWTGGAERQLAQRRHGNELMIDGRAPEIGERFTNPGLAAVLRTLGEEGREGFYNGWIADRIVDEVAHEGGVMTTDDLVRHRGEWVDPISVDYRGHTVWECPPNGQGLAALIALGIYERSEEAAGTSMAGADAVQGATNGNGAADAGAATEVAQTAARLHRQIESMRLAFADAGQWIADPSTDPAPIGALLDPEYLASRAASIKTERAMDPPGPGVDPDAVGTDTVYFCVVDAEGNGCSFINSNYMGFGTGIVPEGCGFTLQNRGRGFTLRDGHPNTLAPGKRPYHTIIPGLLTKDGSFEAVFGVMGGMMQPQGHLQVVAHMVDEQLDPQSALDAPRFCLEDGSTEGPVLVEDSMPDDLVESLRARGHEVEVVSGARRALFGLGQIIATGREGILWAGSDPRGDGHAAGF